MPALQKKHKKSSGHNIKSVMNTRYGAGGGARTRTVLPPRDFKSLASACFATPARSVTSYHRSQHLSSTGNPDGRRAHIARSVRQICAAAADTRHTPLASGQKI